MTEPSDPRGVRQSADSPGSWFMDNLHWWGPLVVLLAGWLSR